ncbi:LuxR C-terminal-related transcriptional regulator [Maribellus sediminis]|uniref:LuxR C-terminal-related transcriptional regulator n=1 Tax=Maribellus sediminis TaxID=2696285 RepID=UPI001430950C|nr:LuxR C-terminal-related transcriptional regulator [Maribellus sediminis]
MLKTKLTKPAPTSKLIFRKELIHTLESGKEKRLTLVSAPAGYGKSTLISQWIDQSDIRYSWYSLDKSDNDIVIFLQYIIAGILSNYKRLQFKTEKLLASNANPSYETLATFLINDLLEIEDHFYIVFDDYHLIENNAINNFIHFLLNNLPQHIHLVLITRSDPSIPLARLRSRQLVTDIRLSDLSFNANNIYDYFKKSLNINLSIEDAKNLEIKTEGWIAGLQLAAISLQGRDDVSDFVEKLRGDNRYIMDYLIEEVLNNQSEEITQFLLFTSVFERLSGSFCNALLSKNNSQQLLDFLEESNMFLIPLDNEHKWYRYHHLFADLLKKRLILGGEDRIKDLQNRASIWFEENEMYTLAIEHALEAENYSRAMQLIDGIVENLWDIAQYSTILKFGSYFPVETILSNKRFCLFYSWMLILYGRLTEAEKYLTQLEEKIIEDKELTGSDNHSLLGKVYILFNTLYTFTGNIEAAFKYSKLALENIDEEDSKWKPWAYIAHGESCILKFELLDGTESFSKAWNYSKKVNNLYLTLVTTAKLAYILKLEGKYKESHKLCSELLTSLESETTAIKKSIEIPASILHSIIGVILIEWNVLDQGLEQAIQGYKLSKNAGDITLLGYCSLLLADSYYRLGDTPKSLEIIHEIESNKSLTLLLSILTYSLKIKIYILNNDLDMANVLLSEKANSQDLSDNFESYFINISKARLYISQFKLEEALALLNNLAVSSEKNNAIELLIEVSLLKVKAHILLGEKTKASDELAKAVTFANPDEFIRLFINEGKDIYAILKELKQTISITSTGLLDSISMDFLNKLLEAFKKETIFNNSAVEDVLSNRELETLKLIAEGLSNQEIADALFLSIHTIKSHVKSILLKLDVDKRSKAVVKAKELNII